MEVHIKMQSPNNDPQLTPQQQYMVDQVIASSAIEDMYPDEECIASLKRVAAGQITVEEAIAQHKRGNKQWATKRTATQTATY